jgi:hypothetical protein
MSTPVLSVVMATADDFDGTYFTIQSFRLFHDCSQVEFIVVDNKPATPAGRRLRRDLEGGKFSIGNCGARYVPLLDVEGTAAPRERAIQEARGKYVICLDSHVMLAPGALAKLFAYFNEHPETNDLLSGPMLHDWMNTWDTHFNAVWRGEMFGIWGNAWEYAGQQFSVIEDNGKARFIRIDAGNELVNVDLNLDLSHDSYETHLRTIGARKLGEDGDVFEIPGMGCGLMAFRKDAWPGFNPAFRGFGGEELYIHEKFRRAGGKCLCLGFLKWLHRFGRPGGVPYRLTIEDKCRNYLIGHLELGMDVTPVRQCFVDSGKLTAGTFDQLLSAVTSQQPEEATTTTTTTTPVPPRRAKGYGPGTELTKLLASIGINPTEKCGCRKVAAVMDEMGVEWCRQRRDYLRQVIAERYAKWGWKDKLSLFAAGAMDVLAGGVSWKLKDKTDPVGSMIDMAIEREEQRLADAGK